MRKLTRVQHEKAAELLEMYMRRHGLVIDATTDPDGFVRKSEGLSQELNHLRGPDGPTVIGNLLEKKEEELHEREQILGALGLRE